jgi:hypothetical protein
MGKDVRVGLVIMDEDELTPAERAAAGLPPPEGEDLVATRPQLARVHAVRDFEGADGLGGSWVRFRAVPDARRSRGVGSRSSSWSGGWRARCMPSRRGGYGPSCSCAPAPAPWPSSRSSRSWSFSRDSTQYCLWRLA